nr:serine/threonine-protein kinase [Saccharopolyspora hordei]
MGEILRAYDTRHDRVVALKLLAADLAADEEFRDRFKREAHAAGRLREPHVIPIHAYGEIDGRLYLDMRLVEGSDVGSLLAAHGPMRPADAVAIVEQVAQALDAAHAEGLVHRDVKPSNILVAPNGFAYLVDFGIAASLRASEKLTSTGYAVGTLAYMAPERFDDGPVDHRADVYSLACVLYQCLTGAKPFSGETAASLVNAHLHQPPPLPTAVRGEVPREFDRVVARGMAKEPADRYASAGQLARAARQALTSVTAVPPVAAAPRRARWPYVLAGWGCSRWPRGRWPSRPGCGPSRGSPSRSRCRRPWPYRPRRPRRPRPPPRRRSSRWRRPNRAGTPRPCRPRRCRPGGARRSPTRASSAAPGASRRSGTTWSRTTPTRTACGSRRSPRPSAARSWSARTRTPRGTRSTATRT